MLDQKNVAWRAKTLRMISVLPAAIRKGGGIGGMAGRMWLIWRRSGWRGVKTSLGVLMRGDGPARMADAGTFARRDYAEWLRRYEPPGHARRDAIASRLAALASRPLISVLMPVYQPDPAMLEQAIRSVRAQIYPNWELCIADDASADPAVQAMLQAHAAQDARIRVALRTTNGNISAASNSALGLVRGDWVALMDHDDLLRDDALYWVAAEIEAHPDAGLIYSDEDKIDVSGHRSAPNFKPDWNLELLRAQNYVSHLGVYRTELVRRVGGFREGAEGAQDHDLTLRCAEKLLPGQIRHIPRVLYHWRVHAASTAATLDAKPYAIRAGEGAVTAHLRRLNVEASVEGANEGYRVRYGVPKPPPRVTVLVTGSVASDDVGQSLKTLREATAFENCEFVVVETPGGDARSIDVGAFNRAVRQASGELVAWLDVGIEVMGVRWLDEMVALACQRDVGCVGARLWDGDGTLLHGGLVLGVGGIAASAHAHLQPGDGGSFQRGVLTQSFSAVSGACLVVRKKVFEDVGGLDDRFAVAYVDVDLCLRVQAAGYRNVWTPYAELRCRRRLPTDIDGHDDEREASAQRVMVMRWADVLRHDPAYNPNLSADQADFSYAWPPRIDQPGAS